MSKTTGLIAEFKQFIARGNVMDMAVGVIVGGAFKAIADSLVNDIINPILGIFAGGNESLSALAIHLPGGGDWSKASTNSTGKRRRPRLLRRLRSPLLRNGC